MARKETEQPAAPAPQPVEVTDVVKTGPQAVVVPDYGDLAGLGYEGDTVRDESIPFLNILQGLSPEVAERTVPGAQVGMLINSATKELFEGEKGLVFQPVHKISSMVEWTPRELGGGLVAMHDPSDPLMVELMKKVNNRPRGPIPFKMEGDKVLTHVIDTVYLYGHILDATGTEVITPCCIPFTSTKLKYWRQFNMNMKTIKGRPPRFAFRARITTFLDRNKRNQTFYSPMIQPFGDGDWIGSLIDFKENPVLLQKTLEMRNGIMGGVLKADYEKTQDTDHEDAEAGVEFEREAF